MLIGQVVGTVVATKKEQELEGITLLIVRGVDQFACVNVSTAEETVARVVSLECGRLHARSAHPQLQGRPA